MSAYRLGFLLCDHALEQLADVYGDYPDMFNSAFAEVSDEIEWHVFDVTRGELPNAVDDCDGYLISGSRHGAYDPLEWIEPLLTFIRAIHAAQQPMVGLCFGHQTIGLALGGSVEKSTQGWGIGIHRYTVAETSPWMQPALEQFVVPVCHQDQVTSLPQQAVLLATSSHCENFVVQFAPNILGIQGHPEFPPAFVADLLQWRRELLPEDTYLAAQKTLAEPHNNMILKGWICRFLGIPLKLV